MPLLLVVALFTVRLHQRSAAVAGTLAVVAAVSVTAGVVLPVSALSDLVGTGPLVAGVSLVMVVAWEGLVMLAVMFLGTAVHRAEHGRTTWRRTARAGVVVAACAVGSAYGYGDGSHFTRRGWITAFLLALLTFGAGLACRHRRIPHPLTGLGTLSYSVCLLHPLLLAVFDHTIGRRRHDHPVLEAAFFAVLLPLCLLTHRYIEAPSQAWGQKKPAHRPGIDGAPLVRMDRGADRLSEAPRQTAAPDRRD